MVKAIRIAEKALGEVHYGVSEQEAKSRVFRKSLFVVKDVKAGEASLTRMSGRFVLVTACILDI